MFAIYNGTMEPFEEGRLGVISPVRLCPDETGTTLLDKELWGGGTKPGISAKGGCGLCLCEWLLRVWIMHVLFRSAALSMHPLPYPKK